MSESTDSISLDLQVGDRVELYTDVDVDAEYGMTAHILFEGTVEQLVEETALLEFAENDTNWAEFMELLDTADGYQVTRGDVLD